MANPSIPSSAPAPGVVHPASKPVSASAPGASAPAAASAPATEGEKPKKEKKVAKPKTGVSRPRLPKFDETHVITVLRPKAKIRESGKRYDEYVNGMTVKTYIDKMTAEPWNRTVGQVYADLRWDTDPNRKLINIGPTVVPIPEPPAKPEKAAKSEPKQAAAE
jgi:hypothetical protein